MKSLEEIADDCPDKCQNKDVYCYKCTDKSEFYRVGK
jgi:hypothetical protein